jgi:homocitrate synthase NifV
MRDDLIIEDTTLRDGEQTPGVALSASKKLKIFNALIDVGVKWIEPGIPAMGGEEVNALKQMLERRDEVTLIGWNRGVRSDIQRSIDLGFRAVHIGLPTSDNHLKNSVRRDRTWLLSTARDMVKLAKDQGCFVSISAEDIGRTEPRFLQEYAVAVAEAGADRLRLSDTIGILSPQGYADRVRTVASAASIDLQAHCHNDFGLAVANTLAAIEAGVRYFHVTVNGIGERAGMADIAQVVMSLRQWHDVDLGIDTAKLTALSRLVSETCAVASSPWQPVVGTNVFAHESGIHTTGMLRDTSTFEPFTPELVGGERHLFVGKHSGRGVIASALGRDAEGLDDAVLDRLLTEVRAEAISRSGSVPPDRLREMAAALTAASR